MRSTFFNKGLWARFLAILAMAFGLLSVTSVAQAQTTTPTPCIGCYTPTAPQVNFITWSNANWAGVAVGNTGAGGEQAAGSNVQGAQSTTVNGATTLTPNGFCNTGDCVNNGAQMMHSTNLFVGAFASHQVTGTGGGPLQAYADAAGNQASFVNTGASWSWNNGGPVIPMEYKKVVQPPAKQ